MLGLSLLLLGVLTQLALCTPLGVDWNDIVEMHSWTEIPRGWKQLTPANADHRLDMRIALKPERPHHLLSVLLQVSDPTHPR